MRKLIVFVALVAATIGGQLFGQTAIYVSTSGDDSNNGATWETAKATLAGALTAATGNTHIYMMVGNYACNDVVVPSGVTVTGGYDTVSAGTDTTQRQYPGPNSRWSNANLCTILDAGQTSRVATVNTGGLLEGCILQNGKVTDLGGGVLIDGGTVMHCVLINNVALDYDDQTAKGGGAYIRNNGYLLNCVVAKNHANNGPGVAGTDGTLTNNTITANVSVSNCGTVTDEDGNVYKTIMIGTQCWMAENLRVTRPVNGQAITYADANGVSQTVPHYYYPGGSSANIVSYGRLYNYPAVLSGDAYSNANPSGVRGICPMGWHVPSAAEWTQLTTFVMAQIPYRCVSGGTNYIAKALASTWGWYSNTYVCNCGNNINANNASGFNAIPAGSSHPSSSYSYSGYDYINERAYYWSSDRRVFSISGSSVSVGGEVNAQSTYSVRCLRD